MGASQSGCCDLLTRTTLQIEDGSSSPSIANVVRALQRVPGVLLAEINTAGARAVVAHDSAVSMASLLAAAADAGARATVVADAGATAAHAYVTPLTGIRVQRLLLLVAALTLLQALIAALSPSLAKNHGLLSILLACVWVLVLFSSGSKRGT